MALFFSKVQTVAKSASQTPPVVIEFPFLPVPTLPCVLSENF
jgi:hypothetical protein